MFGDHFRPVFSRDTDRTVGTLDIRLTAVLTVLAAVVLVVPVQEPTLLRAAAGLPLLLFLPGYALAGALFPASADATPTHASGLWNPEERAITIVERIVIAFVSSVAIVATAAALANVVVGVHLLPIVAIVVAFTLIASLFAYTQRLQLPERKRFSLTQSLSGPTGPSLPSTASGWFVLVAAVLGLLVVGASGAVALADDGDGVTEFYVGGESENGTIAMGEQPANLTAGETATHYVVVEQERATTTEYTVVAELVDGADGRSLSELGRYDMTVNETGHAVQSVDVTLEAEGTDQHVAYYLYEGDAPEQPSEDTALRSLTVDVTADDDGADDSGAADEDTAADGEAADEDAGDDE